MTSSPLEPVLRSEVPILVPRRADRGHRDMLWRFVRNRYEAHGYRCIVEGHHDGGLFSRSAAINRAARLAADWDVAIVVDADVVFDSWAQPHEAAHLALESGALVFAHTTHNMLPWPATERVLKGEPPRAEWAEHSKSYTASSCWAIARESWEKIGGFDERFEGWGGEDWMWFFACTTLVGVKRVRGETFHLWHPRAGEADHPKRANNAELGKRYFDLQGDREGMMAILSEPGGPRNPLGARRLQD